MLVDFSALLMFSTVGPTVYFSTTFYYEAVL